MNFNEVKSLEVGDEVYVIGHYRSDGIPSHVKINGRVKTWVTRPTEIQVPFRWGLRGHGYITHLNMHIFTLTSPDSVRRNEVKPLNERFNRGY